MYGSVYPFEQVHLFHQYLGLTVKQADYTRLKKRRITIYSESTECCSLQLHHIFRTQSKTGTQLRRKGKGRVHSRKETNVVIRSARRSYRLFIHQQNLHARAAVFRHPRYIKFQCGDDVHLDVQDCRLDLCDYCTTRVCITLNSYFVKLDAINCEGADTYLHRHTLHTKPLEYHDAH